MFSKTKIIADAPVFGSTADPGAPRHRPADPVQEFQDAQREFMKSATEEMRQLCLDTEQLSVKSSQRNLIVFKFQNQKTNLLLFQIQK